MSFPKKKAEDKIKTCDEWLEDAKKKRRKREFEWYLNYMFLEGRHYAKYNTVTNQLERPPRKKGEVRMVVNKVQPAIRSIRNYSTRFAPKWEVTPNDTDPETIKGSRRSGKFLDYYYRYNHLEIPLSGLVDTGLMTSVGFVELDWNEEAADGKGDVEFTLHDPFDVYPDPNSRIDRGKIRGRFVAKAIKRSVESVKNDKRYKNRKKVVPDEELAYSDLKSRLIRKRRGSQATAKDEITVKEFQVWLDEPNNQGGRIHLFTYAGGQVLRDEPLEDKEFSTYIYQVPQNPLKLYHRSWVADAIPLNKALNRNISQKIMYVNQALIYRIIAEKGHGANKITNEMGQILEINPGREYGTMDMPPLPQALDSLSGDLNTLIQDVLSSHDASVGRMPAGARSGKTLEALQAAESNNLSGIRQSLESFLSVLGKRILQIAEDKYVATRVIRITDPETTQDPGGNYLKVIGKNTPNEKIKDKEDVVLLSGEGEVNVKIGSWLGYTREAQRETLMKLGEIGVIPADEILRQFEFPNIEELSQKARHERLEQHEMQAEIAGRKGSEGQGADLIALADEENTKMMNGEALPPTEGATIEHTQAHKDFIQTRTFKTVSPEIQQIIISHFKGEMAEHQV